MEVTQEAAEEFDISRFLRNDPKKKTQQFMLYVF